MTALDVTVQSVLQPQVDQTAINYTISQDFAAGLIAEQEKNLQGFLGNGQADLFAAQVATGLRRSHALQDYQMRLMFLEQQNKKRLLLAREEGKVQEQQGYYRSKAAMGKRPRIDTQAEQSYISSASSSKSRKKQRDGAGGRSTNTDLSDKMARQAHGSITAINRDTASHDDSDLGTTGMRSPKSQDHVLVMTSQIRSVRS